MVFSARSAAGARPVKTGAKPPYISEAFTRLMIQNTLW